MPEALVIRSGALEAEIVPGLGAGLARFDWQGVPLFRPWRGGADPFGLASNLLVPWSNRVSGNGFSFEGRFHPLLPNVPGEPCPIHGNGFAAAWSVVSRREDAIELSLGSTGPGPYRYDARVGYRLAGPALEMRLTVISRSELRLPFGLGFHPWLVRTPRTTLEAGFEQVWLETGAHLPDRLVPVESRPEWDFTRARPLPEGWINNAFTGWRRTARVAWPEHRLSLAIEASGLLSTAILYSPSGQADFFCLEPVMHAVDALNDPRGPEAAGMCVLAPGHSCTVACRFTVGS